jgi:hypothetical protein
MVNNLHKLYKIIYIKSDMLFTHDLYTSFDINVVCTNCVQIKHLYQIITVHTYRKNRVNWHQQGQQGKGIRFENMTNYFGFF